MVSDSDDDEDDIESGFSPLHGGDLSLTPSSAPSSAAALPEVA
jgi:hypothetical protein